MHACECVGRHRRTPQCMYRKFRSFSVCLDHHFPTPWIEHLRQHCQFFYRPILCNDRFNLRCSHSVKLDTRRNVCYRDDETGPGRDAFPIWHDPARQNSDQEDEVMIWINDEYCISVTPPATPG